MSEQTEEKVILTEEDYFSLGSFNDLYISSTSLKEIDPTLGGSPLKFKAFFDENAERKDSKSMKLGRKVHKFLESPEEFIVSDIVEPTDMNLQWAKKLHSLFLAKSAELGAAHTPLSILESMVNDNAGNGNLSTLAVDVKGELGIHKSLKDPVKIIEKFKTEVLPYLTFLCKAEGHIALTAQEKKIIDEATKSIQSNNFINDIILGPSIVKEDNEVLFEKFNELVVFWNIEVDGKLIRNKAKIDAVLVSHSEKKILLVDYKTTSNALSLYQWDFRNYRVYRQLAFYGEAVKAYFKPLIDDGYELTFGVIAIETSGFNEVGLFIEPGDSDWIKKGQAEIFALYRRVLFHMDSGDWINPMEVQINGHFQLPRVSELTR